MVLLDRIELSTSPLPRECSTTELQQRRGPEGGAFLGVSAELRKRPEAARGMARDMARDMAGSAATPVARAAAIAAT
jgi:hypothetical protein